MLADPKAAEEVGKGIAAGISEGKGYVDISTIDGDTAKRIKQVCSQHTTHLALLYPSFRTEY